MLVLTLNRSNRLVIDVPPSATPQRVCVELNQSRKQKAEHASVVIRAPREIAISRTASTPPTKRSRNPRRAA